VSGSTEFSDLLAREIVKAFVSDRAADPDGGRTVGPDAGANTLRRLGYGDDHRGATWWDQVERVVWLCAYHGRHRSGEADDPFKKHFPDLIAAGRMKPTAEDYEALFEERDEQFVDFVQADAQALLATAREDLGSEKQALVGGEATVGCLVDVVETLEETYVAFKLGDITYERIVLLLNAFHPASADEWRQTDRLPHRPVNEAEGEVCFSYLKG
jgi:hypothetical protein